MGHLPDSGTTGRGKLYSVQNIHERFCLTSAPFDYIIKLFDDQG